MSPVTVSQAVARLVAEGLLLTRPGSGTFVAPRRESPSQGGIDTSWQALALGDRTLDAQSVTYLSQPGLGGALKLGGGYPHPSLLPTRALAAALARATRRPDAADAPPVTGLPALQAWFAEATGTPAIMPDDVLITSGTQAALGTTFRAIAPAGDVVLVEAPSYLGGLAAIAAARLRAIQVPADEHGVRPELLAAAFKETGARLFYCQPTFQNPTGATLAGDRRECVLRAAAEAGAFIIEDDCGRALAHERAAPAPLLADDHDGRVIYATSLTKAISPNLRVGALIARGPAAERLRSLHLVEHLFIPRPLQEAALELLSAAAWRRHQSALSAELAHRRDTLSNALASKLPDARLTTTPRGGLYLWAALPERINDLSLAARAREAGVLITPGRPHYAAESPGPHIRLSFAATANTDQLVDGVKRLATVM